MKWLLIIFLLINVCYFGWELDRQTRIEVSNSVRPFTVPANVQQLVLLEELENLPGTTPIILLSVADENENRNEIKGEGTGEGGAEFSDKKDPLLQNIVSMMDQGNVMIEKKLIEELVSSPPEFTTNHAQEPEEERMLCVSFGPFAESYQAGELSNWLKENEIQTKQRTESDGKDQLFWIYLSPSESKDEAIAAIEELRGKGIHDYKLIDKGNLQNAISLGLFSNQAAANRRLNELKNIGYLPIMVPYHKTQSIIWVDAKLDKQEITLSDFFNGYPSRFNSVPVKCEKLFTS
ncbi:MAG: SPOR domain-containing protein [Gammaproteobacteria bacterium]